LSFLRLSFLGLPFLGCRFLACRFVLRSFDGRSVRRALLDCGGIVLRDGFAGGRRRFGGGLLRCFDGLRISFNLRGLVRLFRSGLSRRACFRLLRCCGRLRAFRLRFRRCGGDGRRRGRGNQRHGDRRSLALFRRVAERLEDRGERLARAAHERGHGDGDDEAVAVGGAGRRLARRHAGAIGDGGADEVGEPLEDVDAHGAIAADPEARGAIEPRGASLSAANEVRPEAARWGTSSKPFTTSRPPCLSAQSCAASARGAGFSSAGT
jgi:hypothetical protein